MTSVNCTDRVKEAVSENQGSALSVALKENDMDQEAFDAAVRKRQQGDNWRHGDCERISRVAQERMGLRVTSFEAQMLWEEWSRSMAASWLVMDDDDEIQRAIECFVERP